MATPIPSRTNTISLKAVFALIILSVLVAASARAEPAQPVAPWRGTLLQFDFNDASDWPQRIAVGADATVEAKNVGTIDAAGVKDASGGLLLVVNRTEANSEWVAALSSGPLAVQNTETHLGKLTLSFSLSVSAARPVTVRIESFDAQRRRTGGLATAVYPAAPDFYQHYALDLSSMKPVGDGTFNPSAPFVSFAFELSSASGWAAVSRHELRLDNIHYAKPAFYVSPLGKDANDGRTEQTPVATPQKAVELAAPGDIILLMDGTYAGTREIVDFRRGGTPAAWITLKNYPGHQPVLRSSAWNIIKIGRGSPGRPSSNAELAYLEVRGLQVRGNSDEVQTKHAADIGKSKSTTNGNGISVDGRYETTNTAWMNSASPELQYAQIFAQDCDDVRIVNNILVAPVANVSAGEKPETINGAGRCSHFVFAHNLYFGGNQPPLMGENDRIADPLFVNPSTDPAKADFHLKSDSPALKVGRLESFGPITDLEGKLRPLDGSADLGAFQK